MYISGDRNSTHESEASGHFMASIIQSPYSADAGSWTIEGDRNAVSFVFFVNL